MPIHSERLLFRPLRADDVEELVALDRDPEVMRYLTGRASSYAEVAAAVQAGLGHRWMAYEAASGAFVGWFGLRPPDPAEDGLELGYRLRREMWGHGYATEGARVMIELAFDVLGAERVWAQTMAVNTRSRRVMERMGMRYVRTFFVDWDEPLDGSDEGDVEYEITREMWDAARV